ncbi:hypothetical protein [Neobacillus dielmonensis]|uniref:hypothetical protein n=1 Tax=Neobacillus dielmonensis TaxID=1347369 RepID=UPI0005A6A649|nr:hypothetical protein [Neobacillus dielmonensis]
MDKKKKISWGVSFGSLALVAGLTSYFSFSNGNQQTANQTATQNPGINSDTNQQQQDQFGVQVPQQGYGSIYNGDDSTQFGSDSQYSSNDGRGFSRGHHQDQFSNGGQNFGNQSGFDTTTGGT